MLNSNKTSRPIGRLAGRTAYPTRATRLMNTGMKTLRLRTLRAAGFLHRPPMDWVPPHGAYFTLRCATLGCPPAGLPADGCFEIDSKVFRRRHTYSWQREPFQGLRKFRTTVLQRFVATKKPSKKAAVANL